VRAALALWHDHLHSLTEGGERKLVPFQRRPRARADWEFLRSTPFSTIELI
jgi:hypothetical protein